MGIRQLLKSLVLLAICMSEIFLLRLTSKEKWTLSNCLMLIQFRRNVPEHCAITSKLCPKESITSVFGLTATRKEKISALRSFETASKIFQRKILLITFFEQSLVLLLRLIFKHPSPTCGQSQMKTSPIASMQDKSSI